MKTKSLIKFFILTLFLIIISINVFCLEIDIGSTIVYTTDWSNDREFGYSFYVNGTNGIYINWVSGASGVTATNCSIWNYNGSKLFYSASITSNNATFINANLTAGNTYLVTFGSNSGAVNHRFKATASGSLPIKSGDLNITSCGEQTTFWTGGDSSCYDISKIGYTRITSPTTYFDMTALNLWNSNLITSFNATINGTTYTTTNGTINTGINSTAGLVNITFQSVGYFDNTTLNYNVSNDLTTRLYNSIVNIGMRNIVDNSTLSNYTIYFNSTIFCNTTTTNCLNYPANGTYSVNATPNDGVSFHALNQNVTITALQNNTIYFYAHEHQVNITARDSVTNASISNFSINFKSLNTSYEANYTTITGLVEAFAIHNTYNITIDAFGYALYNNVQNVTISSGDQNLVFYLQKNNGVAINIYNEANGSSLNGTSVTIYTYNGTTLIQTNTTSTGEISFYELIPANYTFRFEATNFAVKEYYVEVGNRSFQTLNAYMLQTAYTTIFTFLDETNGNTIQDVTLIIQRYINGSLQVVSSLTSDITGRVQFNYQQNTPYYFTASKTGYNTKPYTLNPILFSSYNVKVTPSTTQTYESDYSGVTITYTPTFFTNGQVNTLSFTFGSPEGRLNAYGFNVTYKGITSQDTGSNAYGEVLSTTINITGASFQDTAQVRYYYTTSDGATNNYAFNIQIVGSQSGNYTIFSNKGQTYGLGDFERILILTIIIILVVGAGTMFSGQFIGGVLGMFVLGFFGYMEFISWWVTYPTLVFLFVYIVWGSSR